MGGIYKMDGEKIIKLNPKIYINSFNPQQEYWMLKRKAKHGFILPKIDEEKFTFVKRPNQEPLYFIDFFQSERLGINNYITSKTELGWRYLGSVQNWHYFIAKKDEFPARTYNDFRPYMQKVRKSLVIPLLSFLVISFIYFSLRGKFGDYWWNTWNMIFDYSCSIGLAVCATYVGRRLTILGYLRNPTADDQAIFGDK
jgi:hypothetical protein